MYDTAENCALLLALLMHRSGKTRCRVSEKTTKYICGRERLKRAFVEDLRDYLEDLGVLLVELDRGGFAMVAISALDGAPSILARGFIRPEIQNARRGDIDRRALLSELGFERGAMAE